MRQHHLKSIIIVVVVFFLITGCQSQNFPSNGSSSPETVTSTPDIPTADTSTNEFESLRFSGALQFHDGGNGSCTSDGYYEIATRSDGISSILYTDFVSNERIVLCNRLECTHDDNTCNAFVGNVACLPVPIAQKNRLVLLYPGWPGPLGGESVPGHIETRDLNGANARTIVTLPSGVEVLTASATDDNTLYVIANTVSPQQAGVLTKRELLQINLITGEMLSVIELSPAQADNIMMIGAFDDVLLLKQIAVGEEFQNFFSSSNNEVSGDWNSMIASQTHKILAITDQKEISELVSWKQLEAKGAILGNRCFICDENGTIRQIDLRTGQSQDIFNLPTAFTLGTVEFQALIDNWVIIDVGPENYTPGQNQIERYAVDTKTGAITKLTQVLSYDGVTRPMPILAQASGKLLIDISMQAISNEVSYDIQGNQKHTFALIEENRFLENSTDYIRLSPL